MAEANKALEATMAQFGWIARNNAEAQAYSMRIVDSWTKIAHNYMVSANDLAQANERAASSARNAGVDFDFLQSMIANGVRNTGRSGAEIGEQVAA
jgi:TP901 family phage tail tape measure protein